MPQVKLGSLTLRDFLTSTELQVHVRPPPPTTYTSTGLETLEISLPPEIVDLLHSHRKEAQALLRINFLAELGEFLYSRVLFREHGLVKITKTLDLTKREGLGRERLLRGMLGGKVWWKKVNGRVEVMFQMGKVGVRRVPRWVLEEFYSQEGITRFGIDDLDL